MNKKILIKGNTHYHVLYGNFEENQDSITILEDCLLKHENSKGDFSNEHFTLEIEPGLWQQSTQMEFNPFDNTTSKVWD